MFQAQTHKSSQKAFLFVVSLCKLKYDESIHLQYYYYSMILIIIPEVLNISIDNSYYTLYTFIIHKSNKRSSEI